MSLVRTFVLRCEAAKNFLGEAADDCIKGAAKNFLEKRPGISLKNGVTKNIIKTTQLNRITNRTMTNRRLRIRLPGISGYRLVP